MVTIELSQCKPTPSPYLKGRELIRRGGDAPEVLVLRGWCLWEVEKVRNYDGESWMRW